MYGWMTDDWQLVVNHAWFISSRLLYKRSYRHDYRWHTYMQQCKWFEYLSRCALWIPPPRAADPACALKGCWFEAWSFRGEMLSFLPCVRSWRVLTSSRTRSWRTCCRMCCRWASCMMPIRSSFLSVSLIKARPEKNRYVHERKEKLQTIVAHSWLLLKFVFHSRWNVARVITNTEFWSFASLLKLEVTWPSVRPKHFNSKAIKKDWTSVFGIADKAVFSLHCYGFLESNV